LVFPRVGENDETTPGLMGQPLNWWKTHIFSVDEIVALVDHAGMDIKDIISAGGGASKLARAVGRTPASVAQWKRVPRELIAKVSSVTGISREKIAPDVFAELPAKEEKV
jgi:hypothetical protein